MRFCLTVLNAVTVNTAKARKHLTVMFRVRQTVNRQVMIMKYGIFFLFFLLASPAMTADEAGHSRRSTDSTAVTESDDRRPRYIVLDSDGRPAYYQEMTDEKVRFYEELAEKSAQEDREAEERAKAERPAAERAVIAMVDTLLWGDFSTFYHNHLHQHAKNSSKRQSFLNICRLLKGRG